LDKIDYVMKQFGLMIGAVLIIVGAMNAQIWEPLGGGLSTQALGVAVDSTNGDFYVVGQFKYAGDSMVNGMARWDGLEFTSVGGGIPDGIRLPPQPTYIYGQPTRIQSFGQEIFVSGSFDTIGGIYPIRDNARWDGQDWLSCGQIDGQLSFDVVNQELFAFGVIKDGTHGVQQSFGRWNGSEFDRFGTPIEFSSLGFMPFGVELYKGEYYFGGNFQEPNNLKEIMRWNGTEWLPLQLGVLGDAQVSVMQVFKDQLFVGGGFYQADGNAKDYFMAWDGNQWYDPLPNVQFTTQVNKLAVIDGSLYIVSRLYVNGDSGWEGPYGIAKWDGINFCAFGGLNIYPWDVAGVDGQIIVTANYTMVNPGSTGYPGDTVKYLGRWIGGDSTDICISQPVRVQDPTWMQNPTISLYPNPTNSSFSLNLPPSATTCTLKIHDITGREVAPARTYHAGDPPVDVAHLSAGLYFVEVRVKDRVEVVKLVKE
jgi:hypothetical protein